MFYNQQSNEQPACSTPVTHRFILLNRENPVHKLLSISGDQPTRTSTATTLANPSPEYAKNQQPNPRDNQFSSRIARLILMTMNKCRSKRTVANMTMKTSTQATEKDVSTIADDLIIKTVFRDPRLELKTAVQVDQLEPVIPRLLDTLEFQTVRIIRT